MHPITALSVIAAAVLVSFTSALPTAQSLTKKSSSNTWTISISLLDSATPQHEVIPVQVLESEAIGIYPTSARSQEPDAEYRSQRQTAEEIRLDITLMAAAVDQAASDVKRLNSGHMNLPNIVDRTEGIASAFAKSADALLGSANLSSTETKNVLDKCLSLGDELMGFAYALVSQRNLFDGTPELAKVGTGLSDVRTNLELWALRLGLILPSSDNTSAIQAKISKASSKLGEAVEAFSKVALSQEPSTQRRLSL